MDSILSGGYTLLAFDSLHATILLTTLTIIAGVLPGLLAIFLAYYLVASVVKTGTGDKNWMMWSMQMLIAFGFFCLFFGASSIPGFGRFMKSGGTPETLTSIYVLKHPGAAPHSAVNASAYALGSFEGLRFISTEEELALGNADNNARTVSGSADASMPVYRISNGEADGMLKSVWTAYNQRLSSGTSVSSDLAISLTNAFTSVMFSAMNAAEVLYVERFNNFNDDTQAQKTPEKKVSFNRTPNADEGLYATLTESVVSGVQKFSTMMETSPEAAQVLAATSSGSSSRIRLEPLGETSLDVAAQDLIDMIRSPSDIPDLPYDEFRQRVLGESGSAGIGLEQSSAFAERYHANGGSGDPLRKGAMYNIASTSCLNNVKAPNINSALAFHPAYFQPSDRITGKITPTEGSCAVPLFGGLCLDDFISAATGSNANFEFQDALSALGNMASQEWEFDVPEWNIETPTAHSLESTMSALESVDLEQFPDMKPCVEIGKDLVALDLTKLEMNGEFISAVDSQFANRDDHADMYNQIAGLPNRHRSDDDSVYAISTDTTGPGGSGNGMNSGSGGSGGSGANSNLANSSLVALSNEFGAAMRPIASVITANYGQMTLEQDVSNTQVEETPKTEDTIMDNVEYIFGMMPGVKIAKAGVKGGKDIASTVWNEGVGAGFGKMADIAGDAIFSVFEELMTFFAIIPIMAIQLLHAIVYYTTMFAAGIFAGLLTLWIMFAIAKLMMGTSDDDSKPLGVALFPAGKLLCYLVAFSALLVVYPFVYSDCMLCMKMARTLLTQGLIAGTSGFVGAISGSKDVAQYGLDAFMVAIAPLGRIIGYGLIPGLLVTLANGKMYQPQSLTSAASAALSAPTSQMGQTVSSVGGKAINAGIGKAVGGGKA